MRSFWFDPYLWIHLAGLAALPLSLELCWAGFAVGDPLLPVWLELLVVAVVGVAPVLWMQWQKPFYIFSLLAITLKPEKLTEDQRRFLTLFKAQRNRILAALVPLVLVIVLHQIYDAAAIASEVVPFPSEWRLTGLLAAAIGFLASNLFLQVPISVASVMLRSESAFAATEPYPLEQIRQSFTLLGFPLNQVLPPVVAEPQPIPAEVATKTPSGKSVPSTPAVEEEAVSAVDQAETVQSNLAVKKQAVSGVESEAIQSDLPDAKTQEIAIEPSTEATTVTESTPTLSQAEGEASADNP